MENNMKLVFFDEYCEKCKYRELEEEEYPCFECLSVAAREFTHVPEKFEEIKKR